MENHILTKLIDDSARLLAMVALGIRPACRLCGCELSARSAASFLAGKRVKCSVCDWYGTWRDNTPLYRSTLKDIQFLSLFYRHSLPDSQADQAALLGISPTTVREWRQRIHTIRDLSA